MGSSVRSCFLVNLKICSGFFLSTIESNIVSYSFMIIKWNNLCKKREKDYYLYWPWYRLCSWVELACIWLLRRNIEIIRISTNGWFYFYFQFLRFIMLGILYHINLWLYIIKTNKLELFAYNFICTFVTIASILRFYYISLKSSFVIYHNM